jgi:hypothetical protein
MAYSISGTVTLDTVGVASIGLRAFADGAIVATAITDGSGDYTLADLADSDTYTVRPYYPGYTFAPAYEDVAISGGNETDVDFAATTLARKPYRVPGTLSVEWVLGQPPTATAEYVGAVGAVSLAVGDIGQFQDANSATVFVGTIDDVSIELVGGRTDYAHWTINMLGHENILRRRVIDLSKLAQTVQDVIDDIDTSVLSEEGIAQGTIDSGTTTVILAKFLNWPVADVLDELAEQIGGYWYVAAWPPVLHLREFGAATAPWALSTSANVRNIVARQHRDEYANVVICNSGADYTDEEVAENATEIAARQVAEGGSGRYERVVTADAEALSAQLLAEADLVLSRHDEFGWEVTYTTDEDDLAVGMDQEVNLATEFGIAAETVMRIQRLVMREVYTDRMEYDVTLQTVDYGGGWERQFQQAFMPGTFGSPRYYRP